MHSRAVSRATRITGQDQNGWCVVVPHASGIRLDGSLLYRVRSAAGEDLLDQFVPVVVRPVEARVDQIAPVSRQHHPVLGDRPEPLHRCGRQRHLDHLGLGHAQR
ncbi:hypothetical protein [Streptomyces cellulosae]|uniref:hypothetical protein n=1 Tax=Streptomyces cellulosae TaxID=1968 RepID=UPI0004CA016A|nr:hypothetical protein [Streptomyces cellulosae]